MQGLQISYQDHYGIIHPKAYATITSIQLLKEHGKESITIRYEIYVSRETYELGKSRIESKNIHMTRHVLDTVVDPEKFNSSPFDWSYYYLFKEIKLFFNAEII